MPVYTLDPRGIPNDGNSTGVGSVHIYGRDFAGIGGSTSTADSWFATRPAPTEVDRRRAMIQQDHLWEIANATGGRAFINRSDVLGAMDEILTENGSYYELGYYPSPAVHDGRFHNIEVKVKRSGTHVRARPGYLAASSATAAPVSLEATLDKALGAGLNVSGLTLNAFAAPLAPGARGTRTAVVIEVEYPVPPDGSRHIDDDLRISVLALDTDGTVKASTSRPWHFAGATPATGKVKFLVDDLIEVPPQPLRLQPLTLRIGVASKALGKAGTLQMPIDVPNFSDSKLQLSGVALAFAGEKREAAMGADALTPLVPFQPTTSRTFAATDTLRVFARAFSGSKDVEASAALTLTGPIVRPLQKVALTKAPRMNGHQQATLDTTLPLTGLTAGDYVLHVDVTLPNGQTARRDVVFAIK